MDKLLESLRIEVEEEKKRLYLARFGRLPDTDAHQQKPLKEFN